MVAARSTDERSSKQDNTLIIYRITQVEAAVRELSSKMDKQDNIKKSDLKEFQETIVNRFLEMRADLQRQIDTKADQDTLDDLKKLVYSFFATTGSIIAGLVVYYITHGAK